jgi:cell division FtsZ-interacting protein ZapD
LQGFLLDSSEVVNFQDEVVSNVRSKQRAVIGFLLAENESITNIHRRLTNVYGDMAVDKSTISLWAEQLASSEQRQGNVSGLLRSSLPSTAVMPATMQRADSPEAKCSTRTSVWEL